MISIYELAFATLEETLNQYISMDPAATRQLAKLHGRVIALEIAGPEIQLFLIPGPARLQILRLHEGEPDCVLRGSPIALTRLGSSGEKDEIQITGDLELGQHFGNILGTLNIDWEEQLAAHMGDFVAHDIMQGIRFVTRHGKQALNGLGAPLKECIQTHAQLLPERQEVEGFLSKVDTLQDDVERLLARFGQLKARQ
ncbi:hypothetical protein MNBD_GAMMA26-749 [hydrothermal vent metagenome]|uniref:SCP2 domain-containing protein n=1 Tax=hydrothermal vent metagenome TaxID=652676 RepID=A0A3B1BMH3_9ZZZZ